jgi:membrane-associated phospholipid phosphatase
LVFVRTKLKVTALMCLFMTAVLALAVAHNRAPYGFEDPALKWLGPPSAIGAWAHLAEFLGTPTIGLVLVASLTLGIVRRAFFRVAAYAVLAAATLLINEHVAKPLVQRTLYGALTFPSGRVTSVCATALAMWLALYPLLGKWARRVSLLLGAAWTLLISLAVVGAHWHTPLDVVGSILMSVGIVTACAAVFDQAVTREPSMGAGHAQVGAQE